MAERHQGVQKCVHHLMSEVEQNIADQVRVDLSLSMSIPLKCAPQAPTLLLGSRAVGAQEDLGCSASSSEQEGSASDHTRAEHPGEEWWKSSLRRGATCKAQEVTTWVFINRGV